MSSDLASVDKVVELHPDTTVQPTHLSREEVLEYLQEMTEELTMMATAHALPQLEGCLIGMQAVINRQRTGDGIRIITR